MTYKKASLTMMLFLWFFFLSLVSIDGYAKADSTLSSMCKGWDDQYLTITEMVAKADIIASMEARSFVESDEFYPLDGYYTLSLNSEFKPLTAPSTIRVPGRRPFEQIPQFYFDTTERHQEITEWGFKGNAIGTSIIQNDKGVCILAPKLVLGYNYLVIHGVMNEHTFEPINSPELDNWFEKIRDETDLQAVRKQELP